jgi:hypothetical protein
MTGEQHNYQQGGYGQSNPYENQGSAPQYSYGQGYNPGQDYNQYGT